MVSVDRGATTLRHCIQETLTPAGQINVPVSSVVGYGTYGVSLRGRPFSYAWAITDRSSGTVMASTPIPKAARIANLAESGPNAESNRTYDMTRGYFCLDTPVLKLITPHLVPSVTPIVPLASFNGGSSATSLPAITNVVTYYKMRARDPDCGTLTYRTWIVTGTPDLTAALYAGARCGVSALVDIAVESTWDVAT